MYPTPNNAKDISPRFAWLPSFLDGHLWRLMILILVLLVYVHSELILSRQYAPETLLVRIANADESTNCSAKITRDEVKYEVQMRELATIYEYLDSSVFTVSSESGYFVLETNLQYYHGYFQIVVQCYSSNNILLTEREYTSESDHHCLIQEKGRLLVC